MRRNILAICDSEQEYAYRLMDAFSRKEGFPFEMLTFTSADRLRESLKEQSVQILLIAQSDFLEEMRSWPVQSIVVLWEEEMPPSEDLPGIGKYSSVPRIMKKVTEVAEEAGSLPRKSLSGHSAAILGIYTPVGRCLQTTVALIAGQLLARNHKVLYLNFECYSGLEQVLSRKFESDFSDLLYHLTEEPEEICRRMERMAEKINGMDMIPPAFFGTDILQMKEAEWNRLLDILQESGYEYVVLDLADGVQGLFDILRRCRSIYTIVREDGFARAKLAQYEQALMRAGYEEVLQKTKKCLLPVFGKLPGDLNHLTNCELTQTVERMLQDEEPQGI